MTKVIPNRSIEKIRRFFDEGFTISELSIMYNTTVNYVERALEDE